MSQLKRLIPDRRLEILPHSRKGRKIESLDNGAVGIEHYGSQSCKGGKLDAK
jgi:hypothetical protein